MSAEQGNAPGAKAGSQDIEGVEPNVDRPADSAPDGTPRPKDKWEWTRRFMDDDALRPGVRHLLHVLASFADEDGANCFPAAPTVARCMGLKRSAVFDALAEAEESGWVEVAPRPGRSSVYRFSIPVDPSGDLDGSATIATSDPSGSLDTTRPAIRTVPSGHPDPYQTKDQTNGGFRERVAFCDRLVIDSWSRVSPSEDERAEVAEMLACTSWSTETLRRFVPWKASAADTVGLLKHWIEKMGGWDDGQVLDRIRPKNSARGRDGGSRASNRPGSRADFGDRSGRVCWGCDTVHQHPSECGEVSSDVG